MVPIPVCINLFIPVLHAGPGVVNKVIDQRFSAFLHLQSNISPWTSEWLETTDLYNIQI